ncbi:MAG: T9SS type A sorting domain-containing protein [Bacteroidia bacterium]|nr:T9SS type A sorting domain-containing protein [Bacteroidia bacterium]
MKKHILTITTIVVLNIMIFCFHNAEAQVSSDIRLYYSDSLQFKTEGKTLVNPFIGGFNLPVFSQVDLNNDGKPDIVVFDRSGGVILTFINTGIANNYNYEYAPQFEYLFNDINTNAFILFRDFNQDGKPDLFTLEGGSNRFRVYMNTTQASDSIIRLRKMGDIYHLHNTGSSLILGGRLADLPIIDDLDQDGDLDYVKYDDSYNTLVLYINEQVEKGLPNDTFAFKLGDLCFGGFRETFGDVNGIILSCNRIYFPNYRREDVDRRHGGGSSLLSIDLDNDGDKELIMGNSSFENLIMLKNGKKELGINYDTMIAYSPYFPNNDGDEAKFKYMPALYHFDVDGDGEKDIIASTYFMTDPKYGTHPIFSDNTWFLKNEGSDEAPYFRIKSKNFLTQESIDLGANVSPVFWDINKDGLIDLLVAVEPDTVKEPSINYTRLYRYNNIGTSQLPVYELVDTDFADFSSFKQMGVTIAIGDMDNDGLEDMVVGNIEGKILFFKNTSLNDSVNNPTFLLKTNNLLGESVGSYAAPAIFDYSQDGKPDLVIGKYDGYFAYYKNTSTGSDPLFTKITDKLGNARSNLYLSDPPIYDAIGMSAPLFYDFEGDGKPELISGSNSGHLKMWYISYDPFYTFPEITNFYGLVNANSDTAWGVRLGANSKIAIAKLRDSSTADVLIGTNRGGFKFLSSRAEIKKLNIQDVPATTYKLNVYPNPNKGEFMIEIPVALSERVLKISIHDYTGRVVKTLNFNKYTDNIVKMEVSEGIYIGTISDQTGMILGTCKIIIAD